MEHVAAWGCYAPGWSCVRLLIACLCAFASRLRGADADSAAASRRCRPRPLQIQPPTISQDLRIVWEVKNRFRLFRREADFRRHLAAQSLKTVLGAEQQMATETDGRGWAAAMLSNLCIDVMGALMATCERDGARESYLAPTDHRVEMRLVGAAPQTTCSWVFDEGDGQPRDYKGPCGEEVRIRLAYGKPSIVTVDVAVPDGPPQRATHRDRGARSADRGARRLGRGGRGQSGPAGRALGRGLLLSPLRHRQRVLSPRPRQFQRRPHLRDPAQRGGRIRRNGRGSARAG